MRVSVVIPIYNVQAYVERCLESVCLQDFRDLEVILVDDCSTDDSMVLVRAFVAAHPDLPCRIVSHEHNRGLSAARNTGLSVATGDYVYFLDSDDSLPEYAIRVLVQALDEGEADVVVGDYELIGADGASSDLKLPEGRLEGNDRILETYAEGLWYVMAWNKLCRREFLTGQSLLFEEGLLHEDVIWTFKVACKAQSMHVVRKVTYRYYVRSGSIMTSMSIEKDLTAYLKAFSKMVDFVRAESRLHGKPEYMILEGKKCGVLYSLLQKGETELYNKYYPSFHRLAYLSPITAYRKGVIGFGYMLRDLHHALPTRVGRAYKRFFYCALYAWRRRRIEGVVWK